MRQTQSNTNTTESIIDSDEGYESSIDSSTSLSQSEVMVRELLINIRHFVDTTEVITYPILYPSRRMFEFLRVTNQYHVECSFLFTESGYVFIERILTNNPYNDITQDSIVNFFLGLQQKFLGAYCMLYPEIPPVLIESNLNAIWEVFLRDLRDSNSLSVVGDYQSMAFISLLLLSVPVVQWVSLLDLFGTSLASNNQLHHMHLLYDLFSVDSRSIAYEVFVQLTKDSSLPLSEIHNGFLDPSFQERVLKSLVQIGNDSLNIAIETQNTSLELAFELSSNELQVLTENSISEMNAIASSQSLLQQVSEIIIWVQGNYIQVTLLSSGAIILWTVSSQLILPGLSKYFSNWLNGNGSSLIRPDITPIQTIRTDALFTPVPVIEDIAVIPANNIEIIANVPSTLPTSVVIITSVVIAGLLVKKVGIIRLFHFFK
jgi:hypothetical protein